MGPLIPRRWIALLATGLAGALAYVAVPHSAASELVLYDGVVLLALCGSLAGLRRAWHAQRLPWLATSLALAAFLAGELIWWGYAAAGQDPFPSVGDALTLFAYLPLGIAAAALARSEGPRDRTAWIDAGVLALVAGLFVWILIMQPTAQDAATPWVSRAVTLAYPLADLLVLGILLRLVLRRGARTWPSILFAAGVAATLAADLVFAWMDLRGLFQPGSWVEAGWLVGYLLLAAAALERSPAPAGPPPEAEGLGRARLAAVLAALLIPLGVLAWELHGAGEMGLNSATVALCVAACVVLLVAARLWGLLTHARELEHRRSEERLAALVHHSADAVLLVDAGGLVTFASPAAEGIWGVAPADCVGRALADLVPAGQRRPLARLLETLAGMPDGSTVPVEASLDDGGDQGRALEGTARNLLHKDGVQAIVVTVRDVTERRSLEAQLRRRAFQDDLTGLANRALFLDRVQHALDRAARRQETGVAAVFIDLDDFKAVNDGLGHSAGDELLREAGARLRSCVRPADTVARLGGDEFALLLEDVPSPAHARRLAERALEMLQMPLRVRDLDLAVPASVGVAMAAPGCSVDGLLQDADLAMYSAKSAGKGRIAMFDDSLRAAAEERLELRAALPEALRLGQLRLEYQPIQDVGGGTLRGFEALLRWDHPQRGAIAPAEFIPHAEESGLIIQIGRWVLGEACGQAAEWRARSGVPYTMNVNVSGVQLRHPEFLDHVAGALAGSGLPAGALVVELTESVLVDQADMIAVLERLHAMGVGVAIDDFGTGYSSLAYLQRFPVTSVKIDGAFVAELAKPGEGALVRSVVALADALSLTTVAEGVETEDQLAALGSLQCGYAQGFFLGHPLRPQDVDAMLDAPPAVPDPDA